MDGLKELLKIMTVSEVAVALGVSYGAVVHWRNGIRSPLRKNAVAMARLGKSKGVKIPVEAWDR